MVVVGFGIGLFFWAVNSGQYDDLDGEAERILFMEPGEEIKVEKHSDTQTLSAQNVKVTNEKND